MNNNVEEKVVAIIEPQVAAGEDKLEKEVTDVGLKAKTFIVQSDEQFAEAAQFGRMLKEKMNEVTTFFAPMKKAAHDAHKQICDREKTMLTPLKDAETVLKKAMSEYQRVKEEERRKAEEEARRLAQEEAQRKLEASIEAEKNGDLEAAEVAMLDAELAESASKQISIASEKPTAAGVSSRKDWEIVSTDDSKIPVSVGGVTIRPVDYGAVMRLIRASKGTVKIEGITYRETSNISFRR